MAKGPLLEGTVLHARWLEVFSFCLKTMQFSGHDIVRLSCTSRTIRGIFPAHLATGDRALARLLVQREVGLASTADPTEQEQHIKAVTYLLSVSEIPPGLMQRDSDRFFRVQRVPTALAEALVAAGTRISYEQLVDAVMGKNIQGIENWVVAQCKLNKQQGLPTGFSELTEAVCSGQEVAEELQEGVDPKTALELMMIALNAGSCDGLSSLCYGRTADQLTPDSLVCVYKAAFHMSNDRGYCVETYDVADVFLEAIMYMMLNKEGQLDLSEDVIMSLYQELIQSLSKPGANPDLVCAFMEHLQDMGSNNYPGSDGNPSAAGIYGLMQLAMRELAEPMHADALKGVLYLLQLSYGCSGMGQRARRRLLQDGTAMGLAPSCLEELQDLNLSGPRAAEIPASYLGDDDYIDHHE